MKKILLILAILVGLFLFGCTQNSQDICPEKTTSCYTQYAIDENNSNICEMIKNPEVSDCYAKISAISKDISICKKLNNEDKITNCYQYAAQLSKDILFCDQLNKTDPNHISCYSNVAKETANYSICDNLDYNMGTSNEKGIDHCYWNIAIEKKDNSFCNKITDENLKKICLN